MSLVSIISFLICFGIIASCFRKNADVLSPARILGFIWSLAVGLADLKLSRLQDQWTLESWVQLLLGPISLLVGIFVMYVLNIGTRPFQLDKIRQIWRAHSINHKALFGIILALFALFLSSYITIYLIQGEIPLFSSRPGFARLNFQMFGLGLFLHNVALVGFFTVLYLLIVNGNRGKKWLLVLATLSSVVLYSITLQRFQVMMTGILSISLLYYTTRHLRFSTISLWVACVLLFFYWVSTARGGQLFLYYLYIDSQMKFSPTYAVFTEPYMYLVMNLENFVRAMERLDHFTYGYYTFDFVTALTGLKHWISEYFALEETPYLTSGYNTYSAFWWFYRDYGIIGITIVPFLLGLSIGLLYYRIRIHPSLQTISAYCVCVFIMIFSFFNNLVSLLWFIYNLIAMYFIFRWIQMKPRLVKILQK